MWCLLLKTPQLDTHRVMSQNRTHIESFPTSAASKNEDPLEDDDAELAIETESSSSVSKSKVESTSE